MSTLWLANNTAPSHLTSTYQYSARIIHITAYHPHDNGLRSVLDPANFRTLGILESSRCSHTRWRRTLVAHAHASACDPFQLTTYVTPVSWAWTAVAPPEHTSVMELPTPVLSLGSEHSTTVSLGILTVHTVLHMHIRMILCTPGIIDFSHPLCAPWLRS